MAAAASRSSTRRFGSGPAAAILYFAAAWPALHLTHTNNASPAWPAAGVGLAMVLWRGPSVWPWIFGADLLVGALSFPRGDDTPGIVLALLVAAVAAGDTLEALAARALIRRKVKAGGRLMTVRGVLHLFRVVPAACAVSATIGTACLAFAAPEVPSGRVWLTWWTGDIAGCLVVGPALYLWLRHGCVMAGGRARVLEFAGFLAVLSVVTWAAFAGWLIPGDPHFPLAFMVLPVLVCGATRFGPREAATGLALSSGIATILTATGSGPFWVGAINISLIVAQAHILLTAGTILALAGSVADRRRVLGRLAAARVRLEGRVAERTSEVERQAQQLRVLASRLAASASRVRQHVAFVLHEDLQQLLVAARMRLSPHGPPAREAGEVDESARQDLDRLIERALATSRDLALQLIPPELSLGGLKLGLSWLARRMKDAHGLEVTLECGATLERVDQEASLAAFDAVRELLFNVVSHAQVRQARILCVADEQLSIEVSDEGRGFDPRAIEDAGLRGPLGLYSLRERLRAVGGSLRVESSPGRGTRIVLSMPLAGS